MSYAYTHLKHKTITDIKIFMHSYNELIQLVMLITDLCLFGSPIGVTELITRTYYKAYTYFLSYTYSELTLIVDLFLFRSPVGHIFILISRKTHTYIDFLVCDTELIHILILISRRTHTYSDSSYTVLNLYIYLDGGTYHVLILLSLIYLFNFPIGVTELMLIQRYP